MIETIKSFSNLAVTWLGIALTIWLVYYAFKFQQRTEITKDQLYKVYLPVFKKLEPHLYKDIDQIGINYLEQLINEIENICYENYELVEPQIISYILRLKDNLQQAKFDKSLANEQFKRICAKVDFEFENCRKKLGLPIRGPYYRLNHKQYETKAGLAYNVFLISWQAIFILVLAAIVVFFL